jgi:CBS domain-containing protein
MKAADFMTSRVVTVRADASVGEAIRHMLQNRISGLPVVDRTESLVGVVTEGDFLRRRESGTERRRPRWLEILLGPGRLADEYVHVHGRKVADVMTREVITIVEDTPIDKIAQLMEHHRVKRLPVVRNNKIVGIVSRANLLHVIAAAAAKAAPLAASDAIIRNRILAEADREPWTPRASVNVIVTDGIVHLHGTTFDDRARHALRVMAENIPGVKGVQDHLVWVEPMSGMVIEADAGSTQPSRTGAG